MFKSGFGTKAWLCILLALAAAMLFGACGRTADIDTANMYLVVYDGNGGYLGNKTATVRKLYCSPDSKIPNYPVSYTETEYIVSSLGLAMRAGYQLLGWYANADYTENPSGEYLYLSTDDGNGAYRLNSAGEYVQKYVASEDGRFIFVYVDELGQEDPEAAPNTYVFIDATREEGEDPLPIESGFHKCNGEEDISEIADDAVREAYRAAYAHWKEILNANI